MSQIAQSGGQFPKVAQKVVGFESREIGDNCNERTRDVQVKL